MSSLGGGIVAAVRWLRRDSSPLLWPKLRRGVSRCHHQAEGRAYRDTWRESRHQLLFCCRAQLVAIRLATNQSTEQDTSSGRGRVWSPRFRRRNIPPRRLLQLGVVAGSPAQGVGCYQQGRVEKHFALCGSLWQVVDPIRMREEIQFW